MKRLFFIFTILSITVLPVTAGSVVSSSSQSMKTVNVKGASSELITRLQSEDKGRENIKRIQELLSVLGYKVGGIDGIAGSKTFKALSDWSNKQAVSLPLKWKKRNRKPCKKYLVSPGDTIAVGAGISGIKLNKKIKKGSLQWAPESWFQKNYQPHIAPGEEWVVAPSGCNLQWVKDSGKYLLTAFCSNNGRKKKMCP